MKILSIFGLVLLFTQCVSTYPTQLTPADLERQRTETKWIIELDENYFEVEILHASAQGIRGNFIDYFPKSDTVINRRNYLNSDQHLFRQQPLVLIKSHDFIKEIDCVNGKTGIIEIGFDEIHQMKMFRKREVLTARSRQIQKYAKFPILICRDSSQGLALQIDSLTPETIYGKAVDMALYGLNELELDYLKNSERFNFAFAHLNQMPLISKDSIVTLPLPQVRAFQFNQIDVKKSITNSILLSSLGSLFILGTIEVSDPGTLGEWGDSSR